MLMRFRPLILIHVFFVTLLAGCSTLESSTTAHANDFKRLGQIESRNDFLVSPNGDIRISIDLNEIGTLTYRIHYKGKAVILASKLGLNLTDTAFDRDLTLDQISEVNMVVDRYTMLQGKQEHIVYTANERIVTLSNAQKMRMAVTFRASDDGVAFRYSILDGRGEIAEFLSESTEFTLPKNTRAWLQPIAIAQTGYANTNPSYEEAYHRDIAVGTAAPSAAGWAFPALFCVDNTWLALSEAGMDGVFHASRLKQRLEDGRYSIGVPMAAENFPGRKLLAAGPLPFNSPWRIVAIGNLADLIESTLGTDLADPAVATMPFVKPGFVAWSWAVLKDEATNYDTQREFIDYAAAMHWPYVLIDALWDTQIGRQPIAQLVEYAAGKGVGLILWYNSSGSWNSTTQTPKSVLTDRDSRLKEFAWLKQIGIKGLKIDFFAGDGKSMMAYYNELAMDAADYGLMLNYHGSTLPRGLQRTYPNLLTMEAIKGFEFITFSQDVADAAPHHLAMLPFTRNLFDPMDFTPTLFSNVSGITRRTTVGFELALPVMFLSGWQHIVEIPSGMATVPNYVKKILGELPVLWDESRLIDGFPGEFVVIARRTGNTWYVAGINGQDHDTSLILDLGFLSTLSGFAISDADSTGQFIQTQVTATATTPIKMKSKGGFLMKFEMSAAIK